MAALLAGRLRGARRGVRAALPSAPRVCRASTRTPRSWWSHPHPDDETLCCAGVIQRVVRAGGRASVVWITSRGCLRDRPAADREEPVREGRRRRATWRKTHARSAQRDRTTGRVRRRAAVLGYPDRGVLRLLTDHRATPYTSGSGRTAVPTRALFRAIPTRVRVSSATRRGARAPASDADSGPEPDDSIPIIAQRACSPSPSAGAAVCCRGVRYWICAWRGRLAQPGG